MFKTFAACGFVVFMLGTVVIGFFVYDASTYKEDNDTGDCPVSELALTPELGGPKNLPIAHFLVDDHDGEDIIRQKDKPRLVVRSVQIGKKNKHNTYFGLGSWLWLGFCSPVEDIES